MNDLPESVIDSKITKISLPENAVTQVHSPRLEKNNFGLIKQTLQVGDNVRIPVPANCRFDHFQCVDKDLKLEVASLPSGEVLQLQSQSQNDQSNSVEIFYKRLEKLAKQSWLQPEMVNSDDLKELTWEDLGFSQNQELLNKLVDLESRAGTLNTLEIVNEVKKIVRGLKIPYKFNGAYIEDNFINDFKTSLSCALSGQGGICNDMSRICYGILTKLGLQVVFRSCVVPNSFGIATNGQRHVDLGIWIPENKRWLDFESTELNDRSLSLDQIKLEIQSWKASQQALVQSIKKSAKEQLPNFAKAWQAIKNLKSKINSAEKLLIDQTKTEELTHLEKVNKFANKKIEGVLYDPEMRRSMERLYKMFYDFWYGDKVTLSDIRKISNGQSALTEVYVGEYKPTKRFESRAQKVNDITLRHFLNSIYYFLNNTNLDKDNKAISLNTTKLNKEEYQINQILTGLNLFEPKQGSLRKQNWATLDGEAQLNFDKLQEALNFLKV